MTWYNPKKTNEIPPSAAKHLARRERDELQEQLRRVCTPAPEPTYADDGVPDITYHQAHGLND